MAEKKKLSAVEKERIELAQKLSNWVNEDPSERACVCILGSGDTTSAVVVGNHRLVVESTISALNTKDSKVREIIKESQMLSVISKMFGE